MWSDPTKWTPNTFAPNNGNGGFDYDVGFSTGTITLDAGVTIEMFTQTGGTLTAPAPATLAINKLFGWTGGVIGGNATVSAAGGIDFSGPGEKRLGSGGNTGATLINLGTANLSGGELRIGASGSIAPGSIFTNQGVFNASDDAGISIVTFGGGAPGFTNAPGGTFIKSGAGTTTHVGVAFHNAGLVSVNEGTLSLTGSGSSSGTFTVAAGAVLNLNSYTLDSGSAFSGPGNVLLDSGVLTVGGPASVEAFTHTGGSLAGTGTLTATGGYQWSGGTIGGLATVEIAGSATLTLSGPDEKRLGSGANTGATLVNHGTAILGGGDLRIGASGSIAPGSIFTNQGVFNASDDAGISIVTFGGGPPGFTNAPGGTFIKSGAGTTTDVGVAFHNAGLVNVNEGTLSLTGAGSGSGTFTVAAGAVLDLNTYTLDSGSAFGGPGTVLLDSGVLTVGGPASVEAFTHTGGSLGGTGTLTATGGYQWSGGTIGGHATVEIAGSATLTLSGPDEKRLGSGANTGATLVNHGTAILGGGELRIGASGSIAPGSIFTNQGVFNASDDAGISIITFGGGPPGFTNAPGGSFIKSGAGTTTDVGVAFHNAGLVSVNEGTLSLTGAGSSSGTFTVAAGAVLDLNTYTLDSGSAFGGPGTVLLDSGVLTVGGPASVEDFTHTGGSLAGTGTLTATGGYQWSGGTIGGLATVEIAGSATLTLSGPDEKRLGSGANTGATLVNHGTAILGGGDLRIGASGSIAPGSIFTNQGVFNASDDADISIITFGGGAPGFTNAPGGTFIKSGAGTTTTVGVAFHNAGLVSVNEGTLQLIVASTPDPASALAFGIGGRTQGSEHAFLRESSGSPLTLAGELRATLTGGFVPSRDDTFIILTSTRDLSGTFSNVTNGRRIVSGDGSGTFRVHYGPSSTYQKDSVVLSTYVSPLITPVTYMEWIASFPMATELTGFEDDPDLDGIANGLENFLGTHPLEANEQPPFISFSASPFAFHHNRSNNIATDIHVVYQWSVDLLNWQAAGEADGDGNSTGFTETVLVDYDAPETDLIEQVVTFNGAEPRRLFARILVELEP